MSPSHAHYRPPDHSKGDESTIGGYAAVHDRPAAFEGSDGFSYSVELMTEQTGDATAPWAGFILFVKWSRIGAQTPEGHLESDYLAPGPSESSARLALGQMALDDVRMLLERLIAERRVVQSTRRWWDAMREDGEET
jgi:hypothetical protein